MIDPLAKVRELMGAGKTDQAEQTLQRLVKRTPGDADALDLLGVLYGSQQHRDRALYYFRLALAARPSDVHIALHAAGALKQMRRESEAADLLLPFVKAHPADPIAATRAGSLLTEAGRLVEARAVIDGALVHSPQDAGLLHALARLHNRVGDSDRARQVFGRLQAVAPNEIGLAFSIANALNYNPDATPREQYAAHRAAARAIVNGISGEPFRHAPTDDPERRLRIGLLSPDFNGHSVMFFAQQILDHLDRAQFERYCYYTRDKVDGFTVRARESADGFAMALRADNRQLARKINEDRIDILIELGGHFSGNSLGAVALRPAPVQMTYIGYPNTTGLDEVDYRIVDSITDPPVPSEERYTSETLLRLDPCFLCYRPSEQFLTVPPSPAAPPDPFTFVSFNAAMKLCGATLALWGRVLAATPGTHLLIKSNGMEEPAVREDLSRRLAAAGLEPGRVEVVGRTEDSLDHMRTYHRGAVALDTFPYNGTTTTCEALFMGVPVLTLAGRTHASRVSASLVTAAGMPELVTRSPEAFVATAAALHADAVRLSRIRTGLRDRFLASPVCDGPEYGRRLGLLLRTAWRNRCRTHPPTQSA